MAIGDAFDRVNTGLGQVVLAFLGGLISVLMRKEASTWQTALIAACGAAFAGFLIAHLCRATGLSEDWTYVFVGVSGWLGAARTLAYLEAIFDSRFRLEPKPAFETDGAETAGAPDKPAETNREST